MALEVDRVRAILFDIDGTLADTDDQFIQRAGAYIRGLSFLFPGRDPTNFLRWAVMVSETPLNLAMGVPDMLGIDDELARFFDWVTGHGRAARPPEPPTGLPGDAGAAAAAALPKTSGRYVLMDGVGPMLPRLAARYPLALVTARGERATLEFVEQFGLGGLFGAVVSAQTAPHTKPYADPVLWAAQALGVPVEHCLMVGDTTVDILAGKRAGAQTVGVLCGFGEQGELERAGATAIVERTREVAEVLMREA
jgi:phosphoglycolate phosphatase-like HAD superfamily hydrolase